MAGRSAQLKGLNVGQCKDLVTIQSPTVTRDDVGGSVMAWADLTTAWVKLNPYHGSRSPFGEQNRTVTSHSIITPYFPTPALNSSMRIVHGSRIFQIIDIDDVEELHEWFFITLLEGVPT